MWLHQANGTMNQWIARKVLGRDDRHLSLRPSSRYANTNGCGSIIVRHRAELAGDVGVICNFGAGYSVGLA